MTPEKHHAEALRWLAIAEAAYPEMENRGSFPVRVAAGLAQVHVALANYRPPAAPDPADNDAVQQMLDDATRAFADAGTSSERVEVIRDLLAGWYAAWPASAVTDEHEGIAHQLVALVDAAEARAAACPCLPGAPEHRHGVGGYSTTPAPEHHVIAFADDGTWSLTHPDTCPDFPDCQVRRLALRQITPDLAALMAGGRYTCEAGNLGDLFQLIDRLHDDQCTPPPCTACGCWCHTEDQTEG